jgi:hypothetical protein
MKWSAGINDARTRGEGEKVLDRERVRLKVHGRTIVGMGNLLLASVTAKRP